MQCGCKKSPFILDMERREKNEQIKKEKKKESVLDKMNCNKRNKMQPRRKRN